MKKVEFDNLVEPDQSDLYVPPAPKEPRHEQFRSRKSFFCRLKKIPYVEAPFGQAGHKEPFRPSMCYLACSSRRSARPGELRVCKTFSKKTSREI